MTKPSHFEGATTPTRIHNMHWCSHRASPACENLGPLWTSADLGRMALVGALISCVPPLGTHHSSSASVAKWTLGRWGFLDPASDDDDEGAASPTRRTRGVPLAVRYRSIRVGSIRGFRSYLLCLRWSHAGGAAGGRVAGWLDGVLVVLRVCGRHAPLSHPVFCGLLDNSSRAAPAAGMRSDQYGKTPDLHPFTRLASHDGGLRVAFCPSMWQSRDRRDSSA